MKIKRYKHARRYLNFYRNVFHFREPHQILIDGTFTQMALRHKTDIKDQMPKYLGGEVQLLTTKCAIAETESLGKELYGAALILKRFLVRKCGHRPNPVSASQCFLSLIGEQNANHYFVATQDPDLSRQVHRIPGTPLLYINFNAIVLEKPSSFSQHQGEEVVSKSVISSHEKDTLKKIKKSVFGEEEQKRRRKKKGPKGPNPLSVKKKKKVGDGHLKKAEEGGKKRRRRKRVKVAEHVKKHLQQETGETR